jgi:protein-S-isoprenylcysteine O-methyltransferase Ste14
MSHDVATLRALALLTPSILVVLPIALKQLSARELGAALLSFTWAFATLPLLGALSIQQGWWHFEAEGGLLLGQPIDVLVGWALFWGPVPLLLARRIPLVLIAGFPLLLDWYLMPELEPLLYLGDQWLIGEILGIAVVLIPAQWLGRWTWDNSRLRARTLLHLAQFIVVMLWLLPHAILVHTGGSWASVFALNTPWTSVVLQILCVLALPGLSAVLEFGERGRGTPVPFDPPTQLVHTGPYAFVANPMQTSTALLYLFLGVVLLSPWVAAAGAMAVVFGSGFAAWSERADLIERYGERWTEYRAHVWMWLPRWRPYVPQPATLWVAQTCGPCKEVGLWFIARAPVGLQIRPALEHAERLTRMTYEHPDGTRVDGITALARALEHLNLAWAFCGMALRLPLVDTVFQVLLDAAGGNLGDLPEPGTEVGSPPGG